MNRRQFLRVSLAAATLLLLRTQLNAAKPGAGTSVAATPSPDTRIPDPTPPQGQGMMTIPFFVGRPRDEKVFIPVIRRTYTE